MTMMRNVNMATRSVRGFTLMELMVTLTVAAVLGILAAPSLRLYLVTQQVRNASFDLTSALSYARSEAAKDNNYVIISAVNGKWQNGWKIQDINCNILQTQAAYDSTSVTLSDWRTGYPLPAPPLPAPAAGTFFTSVAFGKTGRVNSSASFPAACAPASPLVATPTFRIVSVGTSGTTTRCVYLDGSNRVRTGNGVSTNTPC